MIPFVVPMYPDELLYSYIARLAQINCFDDLRVFANAYLYTGQEDPFFRFRRLPYDIRDDLYHFLSEIRTQDSAWTIQMNTTLLPALSALMPRSFASHYIGLLSLYRSKQSIISPIGMLETEIRYCPACMKENRYFHRAHQMPGVTACHKHGVRLKRYEGKQGFEFVMPLDTDTEEAEYHEITYARFCYDWLLDPPQTDIEKLIDAVYRRLSEVGMYDYRSDGGQKNAKSRKSRETWPTLDIGPYIQYMKEAPEVFLQFKHRKDAVNIPSMLAVLTFLFGKVDFLKQYLTPDSDLKAAFEAAAAGHYTLISPWNENIIEMRCMKCHAPFLTSPDRILSGWGCPDCDRTVSEKAMFRRLFDTEGDGEYELLSEYDGASNDVLVRHKVCGAEYSVSVKEFLELHQRCKCEYQFSENQVRKKIQSVGRFDLVSFTRTGEQMTVRCLDCGETFPVMYHWFLKYPSCRKCHFHISPDQTKPDSVFRQEVADLTGDEYVVIGDYTMNKNPILMKHTVCGREFEVAPTNFLRGSRCTACNSVIRLENMKRLVHDASSGAYEWIENLSKHNLRIRSTKTGEELTLLSPLVVQELLRPTPSDILPELIKPSPVRSITPYTITGQLDQWIADHVPAGQPVLLADLIQTGIASKSTVSAYLNNRGAVKIGDGIYRMPQAGENTDASPYVDGQTVVLSWLNEHYAPGQTFALRDVVPLLCELVKPDGSHYQELYIRQTITKFERKGILERVGKGEYSFISV